MTDISKVLASLKKQGVEISAEAEAAAKKEFDGQLLVPSDKVLTDGQIAISKEFNDSKTDDLKALKEKARKLETERDELKQVLESGTDTNKKKLEKLLTENERLKDLASAHLSEKKETWKQAAEKIPETMKRFFKFPAKEGEELTDEEVLANVGKLQEYTDIGAIKLDGSPAPSPSAPRSGPGGGERPLDTAAWQKLPPTEKIAYGYEEDAKKGVDK